MDLSIFLGKVIGIYVIIVSGLYFLRRDLITKVIKDYYKSAPLCMFTGIVALIIGLLITFSHQVWVFDWRVLITLIGYLSLVKGVTILYYPEGLNELSKRITKGHTMNIIGFVNLIIGLFLAISACMS